jgi:hypothetical protein
VRRVGHTVKGPLMEPFASVSPASGCPDWNALIDFDRGKLPAQNLDAIAAHTALCGRCAAVLLGLHGQAVDDPVIARLKQCLKGPPLPNGPAYARMEARARALRVTVASNERTESFTDVGFALEETVDQSIGPYELGEWIGQGGMGVVYRARQVSLDRMVALKMIRAGRSAGDATIARFIHEGKAIARLRHPNVVRVYELGEHRGLPYFSMELVEGGSLQTKLAGGPIEPREAAEIVRTLALAVEYAHQEGVVHRDLKPANILLDRDGTLKIADFGLAKLLDPDTDGVKSIHLTESGAIVGTACYMSPEQAEGRSAFIGPATDVYSLGAILYETLTGRPPFSGSGKLETLERVRSAQPVFPSIIRPEIPVWLEAICLKCLEKSPDHRYDSAQALADDLGCWLRDERPPGIPGRWVRLRRRVRRHLAETLTVLALFSVGAPLIGAGVTFYLNQPERTIRKIQSELALGRPVTLIGETGEPRWSRWRTGKSASQTVLGDDRTFTINTWTLGLLELLPDPQSESYRITAQVRHDKSDPAGEVGLYFAHRAYPQDPSDIHFFIQLTFNAVRGQADFRSRLPDTIKFAHPPVDNSVVLYPHLIMDEKFRPSFDRRLPGTGGPTFKPFGQNNGLWHDLEVIVTPESVSARWNGQPFSTTPSVINHDVNRILTMYPLVLNGPLQQKFRPTFGARGGLGIYLWRGSASFRAVTVTPLPINHPVP